MGSIVDKRRAALRLINQRAGTSRNPEYAVAILDGFIEGGRATPKDYTEIIDFLEAGEPTKMTKAYERMRDRFKSILEMNDMATTKKTATKKTSGFGNDKPVNAKVKPAKEPKGAVDRPKAQATDKRKPFVPTTPAELKDIEKTARVKEETKRGAAAKEAAKTKGSKKSAEKTGKADAAPKRSRFDGSKKITILADGNPKREGSAAHARFALYKTGMTVGRAIELGVTLADIAYDSKHKYIQVA